MRRHVIEHTRLSPSLSVPSVSLGRGLECEHVDHGIIIKQVVEGLKEKVRNDWTGTNNGSTALMMAKGSGPSPDCKGAHWCGIQIQSA